MNDMNEGERNDGSEDEEGEERGEARTSTLKRYLPLPRSSAFMPLKADGSSAYPRRALRMSSREAPLPAVVRAPDATRGRRVRWCLIFFVPMDEKSKQIKIK